MNSLYQLDWPTAMERVGVALSGARWPEPLRVWLETATRADEPWCVALSGGADSVAVLLALAGLPNAERGLRLRSGAALQPAAASVAESEQGVLKQRPTLVALHFNHRLRAAAAEADERFCRDLCAALGVRVIVGSADWPVGSDVSEAQARDARFSFFAQAMAEVGARALWLGHQRDDVVETMLLRLSRGSGARGLAAPRPVQRMADGTVRLRPLLDVPKEEIIAALQESGVPWCEDETNHGEAFFRNRLRRNVVPAWRAAAPADLGAAVARSRALLEEEDAALELWADRVLPAELAGDLPLAALRTAPAAVTRRALHRWLAAQGVGGVLSSAAFDGVLGAVRSGHPVKASLGASAFLLADAECVRIEETNPPPALWSGALLPVPGELVLPDGARLRGDAIDLDDDRRRRICAGDFDEGRTVFLAGQETSSPFLIRHWQPGDRYRPLGATGVAKLQDQFVNRRIDRQLRRRLPVVCAPDGTILWVPGLPPVDDSRISEGTTQALQLTYLPANSLSASAHG